MTTVYLLDNVPVRQLDNNGDPVPGARLHTWVAGTTTSQIAYTDSTATVPLSNPIVADSQGYWPQVWVLGSAYDLQARKADDSSVLWSASSINPGGGFAAAIAIVNAYISSVASSIGASLMGCIQAGAGMIARTVQDKLRDKVSAFDAMTVAQIADVRAGTMTLDVTAAVQAACDACPIGGKVEFPAGRYKLTDAVRITKPMSIVGDGDGSAYNDTNASYIIQTATGKNAFTLVAATANYAFGQYGIIGVKFRDLCIQGNSAATPSLAGIGVDTTVNTGVFHIRENSLQNVTLKYFQNGTAFTGISYLNKFFNVQFVQCLNGSTTLQGASGTPGGQTRYIACTFDLLPATTAVGQGIGISWLTDTEGGDLDVIGCTFADAYRGIVCNDSTHLVALGNHFENLKAANSFAGTTASSGAGIYIPTPSSKGNAAAGGCKTILGNNFNGNDKSIWIDNQSSGLGAGTTASYYPANIDGNASSDTVFLNLTAPAGVFGFTGPEFKVGRSNTNQGTLGPLSASQITGLFQSVSDDRKFRFSRRYAITAGYTSGSAIDILPAGLVITSVRMYLTANASSFSQFNVGDQGSATRYLSFNAQTQALNTWVSYTPTVPPFSVTAAATDKLNLTGSGGILGAAGVIEIDGYVS